MYLKRTPSLFSMSQRYSHRLKRSHVCHNRHRQTVSAIPLCLKKRSDIQMFIFIVLYHRYHWATRTVLQKWNTLVCKIYIFVRCACSGYDLTKELELYFADGNIVHYLSILLTAPPHPPEFYFVASELFSFCHCDVNSHPPSSLLSRRHL
jgi:hypothetical protein